MKHTIHHATLSMVVACIFFNSIFGMDETHKDVVSLPSNNKAVLSFLLTHRMYLFNHKMICSLPINKEWEKVLRDTAQKRRDRLTAHMQRQRFDCDNRIIWHKYGSGWGRKVIESSQTGEWFCILHAGYFGRCGISCCRWNDFQKSISGFERPRFNEEGDFYYYFFEKKSPSAIGGKRQHIVEYCLSQTGSAIANLCAVKITEDKKYCLAYLKSFPILLETFLRCKGVAGQFDIKSYSLKDVIIPDNYKTCIPSSHKYKSFDDLPQELADAINKRYNEQQAGRNVS